MAATSKLRASLARDWTGEYGLDQRNIKDAFQAALADFDSFVATYGTPLEKEVARLKEKTEVLDGTRNAASSPKAAVRRQDLNFAQDLPVSMKSKVVVGTPTAADINALREDVQRLHNIIRLFAQLSQRKTV